MTVKELKEKLDDYGDHLDVIVETESEFCSILYLELQNIEYSKVVIRIGDEK